MLRHHAPSSAVSILPISLFCLLLLGSCAIVVSYDPAWPGRAPPPSMVARSNRPVEIEHSQ